MVSPLVHFLVTELVVASCLLAYLWLRRTPRYRYYTAVCSGEKGQPLPGASVWTVLVKTRWYALAAVLVGTVSMSVHPAVAVMVRPVSSQPDSVLASRLFIPVCCFLVYYVSSYCGRLVGGWVPPPRQCLVLAVSALRVVLVPLMMLCNVQPHAHLTTLLNSDTAFAAVVAALGFSHGLCIMFSLLGVSTAVSEKERQTVVAATVLCLSFGEFFGIVLSNAIVALI